jgi:predicted RNase H-like nuclease (RuvC/YqgF family)
MGKRIIISESERKGILEMHQSAIRKNFLNEDVPTEKPSDKRDADLASQSAKIEQLRSDVKKIKNELRGERFDNAKTKVKSFINNTIESIDKKIDEFKSQRNQKEIQKLMARRNNLQNKLEELENTSDALTDEEKEMLKTILPTIGTYLIGIPFFDKLFKDLKKDGVIGHSN